MKQLLPHLLEVPYGPLHNAILEMGVDATVADVLPVGFTMVNERIVRKPAIVCMILLDLDAMPFCKFFGTRLLLACFLPMRETCESGDSAGARRGPQRWWWSCSV